MEFLKEIVAGIKTIALSVAVALSVSLNIFVFIDISSETGYWFLLLFLGAISFALFNIGIIWIIGNEQLDYKELSRKRDAQIREELDKKEKEIETCLTNPTES